MSSTNDLSFSTVSVAILPCWNASGEKEALNIPMHLAYS